VKLEVAKSILADGQERMMMIQVSGYLDSWEKITNNVRKWVIYCKQSQKTNNKTGKMLAIHGGEDC
jgi:RecA-family ATPase